MKTCRRCGKRLPPSSFSPQEGFQGGRSPVCTSCEANPRGPYLKRNDDPGYRTCKNCRLMLPLTDYSAKQYVCRPCRALLTSNKRNIGWQKDVEQARALGLNTPPE